MRINIALLMLLPFLWGAHARAAVQVLDVFSPSMQKPVRCLVIAPERDDKTPPEALPVLYLLHGWSGHYASWLTDAPQLPELANRFGVLMVCPDGGFDSWYLDSPVEPSVRYETFLTTELIQYVDYYYATKSEKSGRFIAGLSMGGHGALYLALRHPDLYEKAASMAGGLDLRPFRKNDWDLKRVLGDPRTGWKNWENASVSFLLDQPPKQYPQMYIDCGTEDFFLPVNRDVHAKLTNLSVTHRYRERPGGHDVAYWRTAVNDVLEWLMGEP